MKFNPDIHQRRSIRLQSHDYTSTGVYFMTVCTFQRECLFGEMVDGAVRLNARGLMVQECWDAIPDHFSHVELDAFVIMPNHLHGIIFVDRRGTACRALTAESFGRPVGGSVATIIRSFKSAVTRRINAIRDNPGVPVWQRNYYERVIRNDHELHAIRQYISDNPAKWVEDENHPNRL